MSDTAWFNITFKKSDIEKINEILKRVRPTRDDQWWDEVLDDDKDTMSVTIWEANYGGTSITDALLKEKISFNAAYGSGGSYGPGVIVSFNGENAEMPTDIEGTPVVSIGKDCVIPKIELERAKKYYELLKKFHESQER